MNWPGFLSVANAWWLLLLIPLLIFYFLKLKRPTVQISSLALWQSVVNDQRVNSPFQKFRRNILLWLQIVILILLVVAAMQPFVRGTSEPADYQPILIDCSASMSARDRVTGKTRLDLAKERVAELIDNLNPDQQLSLIAVHSSADQLTEFTGNRRVLHGAVDGLQVRDVPSQLEDALRMTQALAKTVPVESSVLFSDGNVPDRVRFALPFRVNFQKIPPADSNAGITAFNARLATAQEWDVFLRVESSADVSGILQLYQEQGLVSEQPFVLTKGESQRLTFRVVTNGATRLEARLVVNRTDFDSLKTDNIAWLDLPAARPLKVFVASGLSSFRRALLAIPAVDVFPQDNQPVQRSVPYDLVISDQASDEELKAAVYLMIGIIPENARSLLGPGTGLTRFLDWDRTAPLLRHVQLRDVEIADAAQPQEGRDAGELDELGFSTIATGTGGPLILQKRSTSSLAFYSLFHTKRSTLEFRVAFPILVANAVNLARQESSIGELRSQKTGIHPAMTLQPDSTFTVMGPDRERQIVKSDESGRVSGVSVSRAGQYRIAGDSSEPVLISASLMSPEETTLQTVDAIQFDEQSVSTTGDTLEVDQPLWTIFAMLGLAFLMIEWWFFQRPVPRSADGRT